jgi:hypothetical protein
MKRATASVARFARHSLFGVKPPWRLALRTQFDLLKPIALAHQPTLLAALLSNFL